MLVTKARRGESKDFPLIKIIDGRRIGLRVKILELDRGSVKIGLHLLEEGIPVLTDSADKV